MKLSHTLTATSAVFDDPNLVSAAGLVPTMALAQRAGLGDLADAHLSVPTDKGANAGLKVTSLVAGMVAGADSIMALLRHGGMSRIFTRAYAPSTLGSFLRAFTFGHVRQLDAVASRFLLALSHLVGFVRPAPQVTQGVEDAVASGGFAFVDVDDTIIEVHGHAKQGAGFGYTRVRGLNALLATLATDTAAPLVVAQRLRKGACGSPRGAQRLVGDAVKQARRLLGDEYPVLVRMDSAYYGRDAVHAAITGGAAVSVTVRLDPAVKTAIATIDQDSWTTIKYPNAIFDEIEQRWVSDAEVAVVPFTAFTGRRKSEHVTCRLIVRRVKRLQRLASDGTEQGELFVTYRHHAFITNSTLGTVEADQRHRDHAIVEQVIAELKDGPLAHLPSGKYAANAAWVACAAIAFNIARAAAVAAGQTKARWATLRTRVINVPGRIATTGRRLVLHLPTHWPWATAWETLHAVATGPPQPATT